MIIDLKLGSQNPLNLEKREAILVIFEKYFLRARTFLFFIFFARDFQDFLSGSETLESGLTLWFLGVYGGIPLVVSDPVDQKKNLRKSENYYQIWNSSSENQELSLRQEIQYDDSEFSQMYFVCWNMMCNSAKRVFVCACKGATGAHCVRVDIVLSILKPLIFRTKLFFEKYVLKPLIFRTKLFLKVLFGKSIVSKKAQFVFTISLIQSTTFRSRIMY